jgi:hypothetical protein
MGQRQESSKAKSPKVVAARGSRDSERDCIVKD